MPLIPKVIVWKGKVKVVLYDAHGTIIGSDSSDRYFSVGVVLNPPPLPPLLQSIEDQVTEYFHNILVREPTPGEPDAWGASIQTVQSLGIDIKEGYISLCKALFNSEEYLSMNRTDSEYVADLYQAFFKEVPDQTVIDTWVDLLSQGWTREMILNGFAFDEEFGAQIASIFETSTALPEYNLIAGYYRGFLGALPDAESFNYWLAELRRAQCGGLQAIKDLSLRIARQFIESPEYIQRNKNNMQYLWDLYDGVLQIFPDVETFYNWLPYLDSEEITRDLLLQDFIDSPEYEGRIQSVIDKEGLLCPSSVISPSGAINTATPTYTWNAVPTAKDYYLWVGDSLDARVYTHYTAASLGCLNSTGNCSVKSNISLEDGPYTWCIQAVRGGDYGPWSEDMNFIIDTIPPNGSININSSAVSTNSRNVTLTLSCSDVLGCSKMKFSNDGTTYSTAESYAPTKAWTLSTGNGTKTVRVKFQDAVDNWSTVFKDTILFDNVAPTTTPASYDDPDPMSLCIFVILSCNDGAGSGCDKTYYTTDGLTPTTSSPVFSTPIKIPVTTTLKFFSTDLADNAEAVKSKTYTIKK